ncbi:helix-turn-helix domain-containing protein [Streptomyces sp. NBC_01367]|uniref:helix-turn-helix domain-containing protein n=1 Tax=Streptomyces sp. NBC_01367 TaxID=2903841 RepID=UPI00386E41A2
MLNVSRYTRGGTPTWALNAVRKLAGVPRPQRRATASTLAKDLRVSVRSVERWRRAWREGGVEALRSAGPANYPAITDAEFAALEEELGKGPSA